MLFLQFGVSVQKKWGESPIAVPELPPIFIPQKAVSFYMFLVFLVSSIVSLINFSRNPKRLIIKASTVNFP